MMINVEGVKGVGGVEGVEGVKDVGGYLRTTTKNRLDAVRLS